MTLRRLVSWVRLVASGRIPCWVSWGSSLPARLETGSSRLRPSSLETSERMSRLTGSRPPRSPRPPRRLVRSWLRSPTRPLALRTLRKPVNCLRSVTSGRRPFWVSWGSSWPARPEIASSRLRTLERLSVRPSTTSPRFSFSRPFRAASTFSSSAIIVSQTKLITEGVK